MGKKVSTEGGDSFNFTELRCESKRVVRVVTWVARRDQVKVSAHGRHFAPVGAMARQAAYAREAVSNCLGWRGRQPVPCRPNLGRQGTWIRWGRDSAW